MNIRKFYENKNDLYCEVDADELDAKENGGSLISINSKILSEITKKLDTINWEIYNPPTYSPILTLHAVDFCQLQCRIFEDDDEYYWIEFFQQGYESACWKCDTKEGLFGFLKDKNIIL